MNLNSQKKLWELLSEFDPMWAILTADEKKGGKWHSDEFFEHGKSEVRALLSDFTSFGLTPGKKSVMDFGCGIGRLTQAFSEHFQQCVGVDISYQMITKARELNRFPDRCQYVVNETVDLRQLQDNSFDIVYSNMVLQHIAPSLSRGYIKEFVRVAKLDGIIVFQMPYYIHWRRLIQWRRRLFALLQAVGVRGTFLVQKLGLNPMRMSYIPRQRVEQILESSNASLVDVKSWSDGKIGSCRYIAVKTSPSDPNK